MRRIAACLLVAPGIGSAGYCADMAAKLRSVSRINEMKRPRWRWL